jgi:hypothetical protein
MKESPGVCYSESAQRRLGENFTRDGLMAVIRLVRLFTVQAEGLEEGGILHL